jgi:hypothetical protein
MYDFAPIEPGMIPNSPFFAETAPENNIQF